MVHYTDKTSEGMAKWILSNAVYCFHDVVKGEGVPVLN
jgi:hypothetical protein